MNGIDFSKYPAASNVIKENNLENEAKEYSMVLTSMDEAAVNIAEMILLCRAAMSNSIPLRKRSKVSSNYYLRQVRNTAHVLAQVEALRDYGLTFEDLDRLVPHQNSIFV
jgi:hypothetical protein